MGDISNITGQTVGGVPYAHIATHCVIFL